MPRKLMLLTVMLCLAAAGYSQQPQENLVKVLRTSNKAQTNKYVCEALEMKNVNPFNVINFFWAVTSREEGGIYSFVHPEGKSGYVVVICPEYQLQTLRDLAKELDRPELTSSPGSKYIYYRMKHRNISDPQLLATARYYLGVTGALLADADTNSVQIFDATEGSLAMEKALTEILDKPLGQVDIKVKLFEVDVNNDGKIGLDAPAWKNSNLSLARFQAQGESMNVNGLGHTHYNNRGSGIYLDYPSSYWDFLVQKGKAKILIDTRIAAINRAPAVLMTGEQILYYEVATDNTLGTPGDERYLLGKTAPAATGALPLLGNGRTVSGGNVRSPWRSSDPNYALTQYPQSSRPIASSVKSADTGISLAVVPTIGEQMVNLDMNLKVVNLRGYDGSGIPILGSREIANSISVQANDEVIMGGLTRERKIQKTHKVPLLGSLPVVGYLFGGEGVVNQKTVVVAVVSPQTVVDGDNFAEADAAFVKKGLGEEVVVLPKSEFCFEQSMKFEF